MADTVEALMRDLLEWLARQEQPYAEVMEAWRTSCPRLPVWEEANDRGFIAHSRGMIGVTQAGRAYLAGRD